MGMKTLKALVDIYYYSDIDTAYNGDDSFDIMIEKSFLRGLPLTHMDLCTKSGDKLGFIRIVQSDGEDCV